MVDFSQLLKKPAGTALKPQTLPAGDYTGIVKGFELGDANKNKTPYVRFHLGLTGWPDSVPEDERGQKGPDGEFHQTDLAKRQMRRDFFLTDDAMFRLDDFIKSCGVNSSGRSYEEVLPELTNTQVLVEVQQYMNQQSNELGNNVGKVIGQS